MSSMKSSKICYFEFKLVSTMKNSKICYLEFKLVSVCFSIPDFLICLQRIQF